MTNLLTAKKHVTSLLLVGALLGGSGLAFAQPAVAAPSAPHVHTAVAAHKLVKPGAYCAGYDHGKKAKAKNGHTYKCSKYSNGKWRWKRV